MTGTRAVLSYAGAIVACVALASGCGGSDDGASATTQWADNVCSGITTWQAAVTDAVDSVKQNPSKDTVESAFDDVKEATSTLGDDLDEAGAPDTKSGDQAKETLDGLRSDLDDDVGKIDDAINDVSDVSGVMTAVSVVSGTLATMTDQITAAVDQLKQLDTDGELQTAFSDAEACSSLQK